MEKKLKQIQEIYSKWTGLFVSSDTAMMQIENILALKSIIVNDLQCFDAINGNIIFEAESAIINYREK